MAKRRLKLTRTRDARFALSPAAPLVVQNDAVSKRRSCRVTVPDRADRFEIERGQTRRVQHSLTEDVEYQAEALVHADVRSGGIHELVGQVGFDALAGVSC